MHIKNHHWQRHLFVEIKSRSNGGGNGTSYHSQQLAYNSEMQGVQGRRCSWGGRLRRGVPRAQARVGHLSTLGQIFKYLENLQIFKSFHAKIAEESLGPMTQDGASTQIEQPQSEAQWSQAARSLSVSKREFHRMSSSWPNFSWLMFSRPSHGARLWGTTWQFFESQGG